MTSTITTLTENSNAHGTERLIQRQTNEGIEEIVYRLGDAGGYHGVTDSIAITIDSDGDYHLDTATDASDYHETLDDAIAAARRQLARA
jgi:hypothetical protein